MRSYAVTNKKSPEATLNDRGGVILLFELHQAKGTNAFLDDQGGRLQHSILRPIDNHPVQCLYLR
jgi:hypothetical protein